MKLKKYYMLILLLLSGSSLFGMHYNPHVLEQQRVRLVNQCLIDAVRSNKINLVLKYINLGANLNMRYDNASAVLAEAINSIDTNSPEAGLVFLNQLISLGGRVDQNDTINRRIVQTINTSDLISQAAFFGLENVLLTLYYLGGDINLRTPYMSNTPLHIAIVRGFTEIADLLIKLGADQEARNRDNLRPFDYIIGGQGAQLRKPQNEIDFGELVSLYDDEPVVSQSTTSQPMTTKELAKYLQEETSRVQNQDTIDFGELVSLYDDEAVSPSTNFMTTEEFARYLQENSH